MIRLARIAIEEIAALAALSSFIFMLTVWADHLTRLP